MRGTRAYSIAAWRHTARPRDRSQCDRTHESPQECVLARHSMSGITSPCSVTMSVLPRQVRVMRAFTLILAAVLGTVLTGAAPATGGAAPDARCQHASTVVVPGAEHVESACLDDLTTAGTVHTGHTVPADYAGLAASATRNPSGVPGLQLDGYFPDDSHTNTNHGWNHGGPFVIRLPQHWNSGPP